jgi:hypothetical protein
MDHKWLVVARKANVSPAIVSAVVWALLDCASQSEPRGSVSAFDTETYSAWSGLEEETVRAVVDALIDKDVIGPDGGFRSWAKRQPQREDGAAERSKAWRERKKTEANATERTRTQPYGAERPDSDSDSESETDTEEDSERATLLPSESVTRAGDERRDRAREQYGDIGDRTRIAVDFPLTPDMIAYGRTEGLNDEEIQHEHARFIQHYVLETGPAGYRHNWVGTFRSWLRKAAAGQRGGVVLGPGGGGGATFSRLGAYQRAAARARAARENSR